MFNRTEILTALRLAHRLPAADLLARLDVSRPTMTRGIHALGAAVVTRGRARRMAYAARRALRGSEAPLPLFRIDIAGRGSEIAQLDLIYPQGCALKFTAGFDWPLPGKMADGWFEGLPYPLADMRPQGFLGRQFARRNATALQVAENPDSWSEDDALIAMMLLGDDLPGDLILGEPAYRRFLAQAQAGGDFIGSDVEAAYLERAEAALTTGLAGSSAGGDLPKFTARRMIEGEPAHLIVKFSGADDSAGALRFADLLVCEHLALEVVARRLGIEASASRVMQAGRRTFLEVRRFDRHGAFGRSPVCSWLALSAALFGLGGRPWTVGAAALRERGLIDADGERDIARLWHFGQLIGNTDMHDGNLAFRPGLKLAPVYDVLPMFYAPVRGVELPVRHFAPPLPLPAEETPWHEAAGAAIEFWQLAAADQRISVAFRRICTDNAQTVSALAKNPALGGLPQ
ncbi:MAG: HipA-like protein [Betaproteobacteria bacterium]|nr:HipA-like protein [Betaproteobacteria bacterium]